MRASLLEETDRGPLEARRPNLVRRDMNLSAPMLPPRLGQWKLPVHSVGQWCSSDRSNSMTVLSQPRGREEESVLESGACLMTEDGSMLIPMSGVWTVHQSRGDDH